MHSFITSSSPHSHCVLERIHQSSSSSSSSSMYKDSGTCYNIPPLPLSSSGPLTMDPRWKSNIEVAPNCPRCASTNTKFCYYNNYSLSQPRYFCKACRRYWTKGGSLRNVPFGGACRKNRRGKSVRASHSGDGSTSTNHSDSDHSPYGSDPAENSGHLSTNASSNIDLALVFSKFLNSSPDPGLPVPGFSNEPFFDTNLNYYYDHSSSVNTRIPDLQVEEVFPPEFGPSVDVDEQAQVVDVDVDSNGYGLQALLSDELWSETPSTLSDFSWQQADVQEWEQFQDDHYFDIPNYGSQNMI